MRCLLTMPAATMRERHSSRNRSSGHGCACHHCPHQQDGTDRWLLKTFVSAGSGLPAAPRWNRIIGRWMAAANIFGFTGLAELASKALGSKKSSFAFRRLPLALLAPAPRGAGRGELQPCGPAPGEAARVSGLKISNCFQVKCEADPRPPRRQERGTAAAAVGLCQIFCCARALEASKRKLQAGESFPASDDPMSQHPSCPGPAYCSGRQMSQGRRLFASTSAGPTWQHYGRCRDSWPRKWSKAYPRSRCPGVPLLRASERLRSPPVLLEAADPRQPRRVSNPQGRLRQAHSRIQIRRGGGRRKRSGSRLAQGRNPLLRLPP